MGAGRPLVGVVGAIGAVGAVGAIGAVGAVGAIGAVGVPSDVGGGKVARRGLPNEARYAFTTDMVENLYRSLRPSGVRCQLTTYTVENLYRRSKRGQCGRCFPPHYGRAKYCVTIIGRGPTGKRRLRHAVPETTFTPRTIAPRTIR